MLINNNVHSDICACIDLKSTGCKWNQWMVLLTILIYYYYRTVVSYKATNKPVYSFDNLNKASEGEYCTS